MNVIVAADKNWGIGKNNQLLVSIPADMKMFREETSGKVVVMGRKTLESFPNGLPLKNRINIVITSNKEYEVKGAIIVHSIEEALEEIKKYPAEDVYCIGGDSIYAQMLPYCDVEELSFKQEDIRIKGHAIECRINAEIPEKNFMPSPGVVQHMHLPAGNGVRVDTALYTGYKIPSEYDSMIAKVIVHAPDREAALQKMRSALDEMVVMGVETNLDFQYQIMKNQVFCDGKADTGFIENVLKIKG